MFTLHFRYELGYWRLLLPSSLEENQTLPSSPLTATQTMWLWELNAGETPLWDIISDKCPGPSGWLRALPSRCLFEFRFTAPQGSKSPGLNTEPWLAASHRPGLKCLHPGLRWYFLSECLRLWIQDKKFFGSKSSHGRSNHPIRKKRGREGERSSELWTG